MVEKNLEEVFVFSWQTYHFQGHKVIKVTETPEIIPVSVLKMNQFIFAMQK